MIMQDALIEALKEFLRVAVLAALPIIIMQLETGEYDYRVIGIAVLIAVLKSADRFIHRLGKSNDDPNLIKGLTRF